MEEIEKWFKVKRYPHIGLPITIRDYGRVREYVNNSSKIAKHSFLPLINKSILKRRYRANKTLKKLTPTRKRERIKDKPKVRDTYFASHIDAMIFSKYSYFLTDKYEKFVEKMPFNDSIVAYRQIAIVKGAKGNKCNIDFAKTAFEFIKYSDQENLTVIVADITSFFDNLDHKILKKNWARVLDNITLPPDHYNVFKALIKIKYVVAQQLFDFYNQTMIVERGVVNSDVKKEFKRKKINNLRFAKEKKAVAYCEKDEFLAKNLSLIISKNNKTGIPQGSPISATLANIYMLDFDSRVYQEISNIGGFYQRYSDDIIIVCKQEDENVAINLIRDAIKSNEVKLIVEPDKTKVYHFEKRGGDFLGFAINEITKNPIYGKHLEYLGFSFDGKRVLIKSGGFAKFYRSMKGSFNRAVDYALNSKNPDKSLFMGKLYKRFTFKGANRKLIYRPSKLDPKVFEASRTYYWGNYLSYVYKANETLKALNGNDAVKKQSRKFWNKFSSLSKLAKSKL
ncbi:reverse transcriptase/maturase family protein [Pedobacter sp. Leaf176]|uniref:reverse transcriptase/maturase family protein n=1 Tax=Pedobacter sp. Leaf176 TaxID=1736286 RepID=UPI0006FDD5EB|nr:reverse transcriptase/maturase family protein [Pedobacter sp. Leaf176]KQR70777.1 hypothetical protein ASF92_09700 [Pedobacter sp. Leaf176]